MARLESSASIEIPVQAMIIRSHRICARESYVFTCISCSLSRRFLHPPANVLSSLASYDLFPELPKVRIEEKELCDSLLLFAGPNSLLVLLSLHTCHSSAALSDTDTDNVNFRTPAHTIHHVPFKHFLTCFPSHVVLWTD